MKNRYIRSTIASAIVGLAVMSAHARAAILYDGAGFLTGTQSFSDTLNLPSAGTLTVTLGDIAWPQSLASLNMVVTTPSGALGPEMGIGTSIFNVTAGGNVTTQWFGTAQGPMDAGVYTLEIQFQPLGTVVPLPTSIGLLLSGLGLLIWQRRRRGESAPPAAAEATLSS
ncbi:MAG TPA: PEP-CTERM sorting domain-containing protein [Steroidobacteraceae bacterium]